MNFGSWDMSENQIIIIYDLFESRPCSLLIVEGATPSLYFTHRSPPERGKRRFSAARGSAGTSAVPGSGGPAASRTGAAAGPAAPAAAGTRGPRRGRRPRPPLLPLPRGRRRGCAAAAVRGLLEGEEGAGEELAGAVCVGGDGEYCGIKKAILKAMDHMNFRGSCQPVNMGVVVMWPVEKGGGATVALAAHAVVVVAASGVIGCGGRCGCGRHRRSEFLLQLGLSWAALMLHRCKTIKVYCSTKTPSHVFLRRFSDTDKVTLPQSSCTLTVSVHGGLEALFEPACPALVPVRLVDGAAALVVALGLARVDPVPMDAPLEESRAT